MTAQGPVALAWEAVVEAVPAIGWPAFERPPGAALGWLWDLAHEEAERAEDKATMEAFEQIVVHGEVDQWAEGMARIATGYSALKTEQMFTLCSDLRVSHMRLTIPWGDDLTLEDWARAHLAWVAQVAIKTMALTRHGSDTKESP